jgi:putative SOS response-associated peptidase YedK
MCGRFTQNYTWHQVHEFLSVFGAPRNPRPRYNIAPTTMIDVVRLNAEGKRKLVSMRWGLVPFFWKKSLKDLKTACKWGPGGPRDSLILTRREIELAAALI